MLPLLYILLRYLYFYKQKIPLPICELLFNLSIYYSIYSIVRYLQASEGGCSRGTYLLGHLYLRGRMRNRHESYALLSQAALQGQVDAYECLGTCYEYGIGVDMDAMIALDYYRRSAKLGSKLGMYNLGYLLVKNAIEESSSNSNSGGRTGRLSHKYLSNNSSGNNNDNNIASIVQEGVHWLRAASENGVMDASFQLGRLYEQVRLVNNNNNNKYK